MWSKIVDWIADAYRGNKTSGSIAHFYIGEDKDKRIAELENALQGLLNDTQHSDHDCGDERCPVEEARRVRKGGAE